MTTAQKVFKNFFSLTTSYILTSIISFLATVYLAQNLGAAGFGKISFAYSLLVYFLMLSNPGLDRLGIRELARDVNKINQVGKIVTLRILLAIICLLLLIVVALVLPKPADIKILIILYGISILTYALLLEWVYQGIERMEFVSISRIIDKMLYFVLIIIIVQNQDQILFIPVFWLTGSLSACLFLLFVFLIKYGKLHLSFDFPVFKKLLKQAIPIGVSYFITQLFFNFDIIMLGLIKTEGEVGIYQAGSKIIQLLLPLFNLFFIAIFPILSRMYKENKEKIKYLLEIILKYLMIICFPLISVGTLTAKNIIQFLYGSEYVEGVLVFQILLWTLTCFIVGYTFTNLLLACDREKKLLIGMTLGTTVNIICNIVLIPLFSINGAAIATIAGSFIMLIYLFYQSRKISRIPFIKNIPLPFISVFITIIVIYVFKVTNIFLLLLIGIGGYFSLIFLFRCITWKEIRVVKNQLLGRE